MATCTHRHRKLIVLSLLATELGEKLKIQLQPCDIETCLTVPVF